MPIFQVPTIESVQGFVFLCLQRYRGFSMYRPLIPIASAFFALLAKPVFAQFAVCNQTLDVINVAIGQYDIDAFETSGWWTIGPNQCANVIDSQLSSRYIYVFGQDVFGKSIVTGSTPMCVAPDRFEIRGDQDCLIRGLIEARFQEVDTLRSERWTMFIYPPP